jgi:hypothetical protein
VGRPRADLGRAVGEEAVTGSNRLPILASSINEHLKAAETATRHGLEHAIAAGLLLLEAKELVGHGEWLAWLQANCRLGQRQAQTYMRLARNRHRLEAVENAATAHLTIGAAEALVGRPRPERRRGLPGQFDLLGGPEVTIEPGRDIRARDGRLNIREEQPTLVSPEVIPGSGFILGLLSLPA